MGAGSRIAKVGSAWLVAAGLTFVGIAPAAAQDDDEELPATSRAVVQPLPNGGTAQLNAALTRLAVNPRDVAALLDAGNAAMTLGDTDAALGFYGRADQLAPGDARVKSALASAKVRSEDPFAAIPLFDAAERAGARDPLLMGERGLAYDLVGDNVDAQKYYRQALAVAPGNDEIARRLALSLAIAGDRKGSEAALLGQLRRNEPAAWRTRAFALAILGDTEEAVRIAGGTMPRDLSDAIIPYLRYMGRLTPAQQAAAANFGHFPRAAQIGRDDPRVARYAALNPRKPVTVASAAAAPAATGKKGKAARADAKTKDQRRADRLAQAQAQAQAKALPARTVTVVSAASIAGAGVVSRPAPPPVRVAAATPNPFAASRLGPASGSQATAVASSAAPAATAPIFGAPVRQIPAPSGAGGLATSTVSVGPPAGVAPAAAAVALPAQVRTAAPIGPPALALPGPATTTPVPAQSNLDLAVRAQAGSAPATVVAAPAVAAPAPEPAVAFPKRDFASAFGDFRPPPEEQPSATAVDLAAIAKARAQRAAKSEERGPVPDAPKDIRRVALAEPAASSAKSPPGKGAKATKVDAAAKAKPNKPEAPAHPSRIWVQVGVGRDKGALAFDWRKYQRGEAELFKGKKAWTTQWGQTNRLLVGPFETQAAAQAFLKAVKKAEAGAFVWTSPAGQAVDALAAK